MIRLVALDLDGTVLGPDMKPVESARKAIQEATRAGVRVALATGRSYISGARYAAALDLPYGPLIAYNGAIIEEYPGGGLHRKRPLPEGVVEKVIDFCQRHDIYLQLHPEGDRCYSSKECRWSLEHTRITGTPPTGIGDLFRFVEGETLKLCAMGTPEELKLITASVKSMFGNMVSLTGSFPFVLEIVHPEANKGDALRYVSGALGIDKSEVKACGDSLNDVEMIRWAGTGVIMEQAEEAVKAAADWVAPGGCGEGVAQAIRRFVLEPMGLKKVCNG